MALGFKVIQNWCYANLVLAAIVLSGVLHLGTYTLFTGWARTSLLLIIFVKIIYEIGLLVGIYFESKTIIRPTVALLSISFLFNAFSFIIGINYGFWFIIEGWILGYLFYKRKYFT